MLGSRSKRESVSRGCNARLGTFHYTTLPFVIGARSQMQLYSYVAGLTPKKNILFERTDARLGLVPNCDQDIKAVSCFDIFLRRRVDLDPAWLDSEFHIDVEISDLIIDLNLAGFVTSGCCRGKYGSREQQHLDAAYITFKDYLPQYLVAELNHAGLQCTEFSEQARQATPFFLNMRFRVNSWIRDGRTLQAPLTTEQIALNTAFERHIRKAFGTHLPAGSAEIRRLAEASGTCNGGLVSCTSFQRACTSTGHRSDGGRRNNAGGRPGASRLFLWLGKYVLTSTRPAVREQSINSGPGGRSPRNSVNCRRNQLARSSVRHISTHPQELLSRYRALASNGARKTFRPK